MNDKKDKTNLRYMDLEKEENSQKEDLIKKMKIMKKKIENKQILKKIQKTKLKIKILI